MKLSIVVPAYNEEGRIGKMLAAYLEYFAGRYGNDFELIVSVNGSTDGTEAVVRALQPRHPRSGDLRRRGIPGSGGRLAVRCHRTRARR